MNREAFGAGVTFVLFGAIGAFRPAWVVGFDRWLKSLAGSESRYDRDPDWIPAMRVGSAMLMVVGIILVLSARAPA